MNRQAIPEIYFGYTFSASIAIDEKFYIININKQITH